MKQAVVNTTEKKEYPDLLLHLSTLLNALAHPARMQILLLLTRYADCPAGGISENLPLSKSTVSEHLNKLKKTGYITCSPEGYCNNYQINDKLFEDLRALQHEFIAQLEVWKKHRSKCNDIDNKLINKINSLK